MTRADGRRLRVAAFTDQHDAQCEPAADRLRSYGVGCSVLLRGLASTDAGQRLDSAGLEPGAARTADPTRRRRESTHRDGRLSQAAKAACTQPGQVEESARSRLAFAGRRSGSSGGNVHTRDTVARAIGRRGRSGARPIRADLRGGSTGKRDGLSWQCRPSPCASCSRAGVHFGHSTRRWNPKMAPYLFGVRNGIHIIDLDQTVPLLHRGAARRPRRRRRRRPRAVRRHQAAGERAASPTPPSAAASTTSTTAGSAAC